MKFDSFRLFDKNTKALVNQNQIQLQVTNNSNSPNFLENRVQNQE